MFIKHLFCAKNFAKLFYTDYLTCNNSVIQTTESSIFGDDETKERV